jgi:hypothetical protein
LLKRGRLRNVEFRVGNVVEEVRKASQDDAGYHLNDVGIIKTRRTDRRQLLIAHLSTAGKNVVGKRKSRFRPTII